MKPAAIALLSALVVLGAGAARGANPETVLFSGRDYKFVVASCKAEPIEKEKKQRIALIVACEVPKDSRFILFVARTATTDLLEGTIATQESKGIPREEVKLEFQMSAQPASFFVGLWRGLGHGSPSGIVCDGAVVSFPLKIQSAFRHG